MMKEIYGIEFYELHDYYNQFMKILKDGKIESDNERLQLLSIEFEKMLSVAPDILTDELKDESKDLKEAYFEFRKLYETVKMTLGDANLLVEKLLEDYESAFQINEIKSPNQLVDYLYNTLLQVYKSKNGHLIDRIEKANETFSAILDLMDLMSPEEYEKCSTTIKQAYLIVIGLRNQALSFSDSYLKNARAKEQTIKLETRYFEMAKKFKKSNTERYVPKLLNPIEED